MHKLIISDLDGTLLPSHSTKLSPAVCSAIESSVRNGAVFCVCSGRSYVQLKSIFTAVSVPVYFICCDGAICIYKEQTLFETPLTFDVSKQIKENLLAYGKYLIYASKNNLPFYRQAVQNYNGHILPLADCKEASIYKLAFKNAALREFPMLQRVYQKNGWQEYVQKGVSKGNAVLKLQNLLGISKEETLVLGDGENDISMTGCGRSYLIGKGFFGANAHFDAQAPDFLSAMKQEKLKNKGGAL